jgi:hypothetical protein
MRKRKPFTLKSSIVCLIWIIGCIVRHSATSGNPGTGSRFVHLIKFFCQFDQSYPLLRRRHPGVESGRLRLQLLIPRRRRAKLIMLNCPMTPARKSCIGYHASI